MGRQTSVEYSQMVERLAEAIENALDTYNYEATKIRRAKWIVTLPNGERRQVDVRVGKDEQSTQHRRGEE